MKSFTQMQVCDLKGILNLDEVLISHKKLLDILHYNPDTGIFTWRLTRGFKAKSGEVAGSIDEKGYVIIFTECRVYKAHRLAWFYMKGEWPKEIDHINRIKHDNRWCNLRLATRQENSWNVGLRKNNTSGYTGVVWNKQNNKWQARATVNGEYIHLGFFNQKEDAANAYKNFAEKRHGEFFSGKSELLNITK